MVDKGENGSRTKEVKRGKGRGVEYTNAKNEWKAYEEKEDSKKFWKVSGSVAGFVVTVQCLSVAPSCTHMSRAFASSLIKLWISHLKSFLFAHLPPRELHVSGSGARKNFG